MDRFLGRDGLLREVVRHLRGARGVALSGVPWVGRTRLLREALDQVDAPTVLCRPTAAGRGIPFAGLGSLAPSQPDAPGTWMDELVDRMEEGAIVAVDGAQFLDAHSALLLFRAVEERRFRVALSVWRGHPAPDAVTSMWTDGLVPLVEVDPLDRETSDELVRELLGGPVEEALLQHVWERCRGFPLLMRELLLGGVQDERIVRRDALWTALAPLRGTTALADAAQQVMRDLTDEERTGLELLALGEPLRAEVVDALLDPVAVDRLEQQQMAILDVERGGYVLPAPGWADGIAGGLTAVRRRSLLRDLALAAPPLAELEGMELVRVACWRVEAGLGGEGEMLARAASHAAAHGLLDHARPLAEAAIPDAPTEGRLALADVLSRLDDHDGAVAALDEAARLDHTPRRLEALVAAAQIRFFRQGQRDGAIAALQEATASQPEPDRWRLEAAQALLVALAGDLPKAAEQARRVLERTPHRDRTRLEACMAGGLALTWYGRLEEGGALVREGLGLVRDVGGQADEMRLDLILEMAESYIGHPDTAIQLGRDRYQRALEADAVGIAAVWATQLGATLLNVGQVGESRRRATEGVRLAERDDELTVLPLAAGIAAMAAAAQGDVPGARHWQSRMVEERRLQDARSRIMHDRVAVAVRAAEFDLEGAADLAVSAGRDAADADHLVWALNLLHEAVRIGYADRAVEDAIAIGERVDGPWAETVVRHAEVSADEDLAGLERVGDRYAALGFTLPAVEAYAEAARLASTRDQASRAGVLRARARELRRLIPDALTPSLRGLGTEPLTKREREVSLLAAEGLTSREIAERLVVSPRTVDNHLASVYRKLDIDGRADLARALGTDRGDRPAAG